MNYFRGSSSNYLQNTLKMSSGVVSEIPTGILPGTHSFRFLHGIYGIPLGILEVNPSNISTILFPRIIRKKSGIPPKFSSRKSFRKSPRIASRVTSIIYSKNSLHIFQGFFQKLSLSSHTNSLLIVFKIISKFL